jgi:hypothetical protein
MTVSTHAYPAMDLDVLTETVNLQYAGNVYLRNQNPKSASMVMKHDGKRKLDLARNALKRVVVGSVSSVDTIFAQNAHQLLYKALNVPIITLKSGGL